MVRSLCSIWSAAFLARYSHTGLVSHYRSDIPITGLVSHCRYSHTGLVSHYMYSHTGLVSHCRCFHTVLISHSRYFHTGLVSHCKYFHTGLVSHCRYSRTGLVAGKIFILLGVINHLFLLFLEWLAPTEVSFTVYKSHFSYPSFNSYMILNSVLTRMQATSLYFRI